MSDQFPRRRLIQRSGAGLAGSLFAFQAGQQIAGAAPPAGAGPDFDVRTFGARGDGKTIDTPAINKAIEAAAMAGGGTVRVTAGTYPSYSIHLKSKVSLYLGPGAVLLATDPPPPCSGGGYDDAEPMHLDKSKDYG